MEDEEKIIYVYTEAIIAFDVAVTPEATDDEIKKEFLNNFKVWVEQGGAPNLRTVRITRENKS